MASDDVLAEWEMRSHIAETDAADRVTVNGLLACGNSLAAKVRELRKDKARLDWVLRNNALVRSPLIKSEAVCQMMIRRIDAAMGGES